MLSKRVRLCALVVLAVLLIACTSAPVIAPQPTNTPAIFSFDPTSRLLKARKDQFKGRLAFSIAEQASQCHAPRDDPFKMQLEFQNTSPSPVLLRTQFLIGNSYNRRYEPNFNLFPVINSANGRTVSYALGAVDFLGFAAEPSDFKELQPQETFNTTVDFYFPSFVEEGENLIPPNGGNYTFKFVYINSVVGPDVSFPSYDSYDWNAWVGEIESNEVQICVQTN